MPWTKLLRLLSATILSVAVFQFVLLGCFGGFHDEAPSLWEHYVSPWLSRLLMAGPVIAAAVVTGCLARPRRPERVAAAVGGAGAFSILVWQFLPGVTHVIKQAAAAIMAGSSLGAMSPRYELPSAAQFLDATWVTLWVGCVPAAVACWVGANYWRSESWRLFWRGPGGAILKGGLIAGAAAIAISLTRWYGPWNAVTREHIQAVAKATGQAAAPWWHPVFLSLSLVGGAFTITAFLVSLRPAPVLGAFAGSGLALGVLAISELLSRLEGLHMATASGLGVKLGLAFYTFLLLQTVARGAIAGVFAGRWQDEGTE